MINSVTTPLNIVIYGYYSMKNLGDEMFEYVFSNLLKNHNILFQNPNQLKDIPENTDLLLCGGGDIINDYFMLPLIKIKDIWEKKYEKNLVCYAVSFGLSFPDQIVKGSTHYLDIFDKYIVRNQSDYALLKIRYGEKHVRYLNDLVFCFENTVIYPKEKDVIGFFLARPVCAEGLNPFYENFVEKMAELVETLSNTYKIELVTCDWGNSLGNNDILINNDVYGKLSPKKQTRVSIINLGDAVAISNYFQKYTFTVCMRYHSHILSFINNIPMVSLSMTNKVKYFMREKGLLDHVVFLEKEGKNIKLPSLDPIYSIIEKIVFFKEATVIEPIPISSIKDNYMDELTNDIQIRVSSPIYLNDNDINTMYNNVIQNLYTAICKYKNIQTKNKEKLSSKLNKIKHGLFENTIAFLFKKKTVTINSHFIPSYKNVKEMYYQITGTTLEKSDILVEILAKIFNYTLTGKFDSIYAWGIQQQIFEMDLFESVKYILNYDFYFFRTKHIYNKMTDDNSNNNLPNVFSNLPKLNMEYIELQSMDGFHRAGWKYVTNYLQNIYNDVNSDIILDVCVDSTFHWNKNVLKLMEKIPYTKKWIGFVHHTPNEDYTIYNTTSLVNDPLFQESLKNCVCLILLSKYLKDWFDAEFLKRGIHVKTVLLYHPTEFPEIGFTFQKFLDNPEKKLVQIGGWMRNSYAIYDLSLNTKKTNIQKAYLKGKMMENYFKPPNFDLSCLINTVYPPTITDNPYYEDEEEGFIERCGGPSYPCGGPSCPQIGCGGPGPSHSEFQSQNNVYLRGLIHSIKDKDASVKTLTQLSNDDYDALLNNNIVFLNLVEASACNTLIECVVRNTPLIINKLPAIVEILGEDYPLYYDNLVEAGELIVDMDILEKGYNYLVHLDKSILRIETFLQDFQDKVISLLF